MKLSWKFFKSIYNSICYREEKVNLDRQASAHTHMHARSKNFFLKQPHIIVIKKFENCGYNTARVRGWGKTKKKSWKTALTAILFFRMTHEAKNIPTQDFLMLNVKSLTTLRRRTWAKSIVSIASVDTIIRGCLGERSQPDHVLAHLNNPLVIAKLLNITIKMKG